jgi:hypothetical protein
VVKLSILLSFVFLISCSSIKFKSSHQISTSFDEREFQTKKVSVEVEKTFYMWGLVPGEQVIEIDKLFSKKGFDSVSSIEIKETKTKSKTLWMFLTLGMYYPQHYSITAKTGT